MCSFGVLTSISQLSPNFRLMWMAHMSVSQCDPIPHAKTLGSEHPGLYNISQDCAVMYPSHDFSYKHQSGFPIGNLSLKDCNVVKTVW